VDKKMPAKVQALAFENGHLEDKDAKMQEILS